MKSKEIKTSELEKRVGCRFQNKDLLMEALTHRSFYHENPEQAPAHNERLEFLGDSVLGLVVVDYLYSSGHGYSSGYGPEGSLRESMMSKIKSYVVKGAVLSEVAKGISLGSYLRLGRGEEETGGRHKASILTDVLEALIGAVYVDLGYEKARGLILGLFKEKLDAAILSGDFHDYKSELQEEVQMKSGVLPEYRLVKEEGQEHKKIFTVDVYVSGKHSGRGIGRSKKEAQVRAAKEALESLLIKN